MISKIRTCDVCGKDITNDTRRFIFKEYEYNYANYEEPEWSKYSKRDMCEECFKEIQRFLKCKQCELECLRKEVE